MAKNDWEKNLQSETLSTSDTDILALSKIAFNVHLLLFKLNDDLDLLCVV